ncbi:hypothetical protein BOTBODRAFT_180403 [Botryobasidium botryosum FD-172 SS1]|uniref:NADP-dependent oxidoreductase domain-containing protein n=1 Tax=Botryobasidium botryosum (strain FD-172 SS1) TaxID=930990 RepID=A0A067M7N4_BOTB1|nr:hypothetical protein BOTBODRAFT_180403 [Botryobasidium botryosum FD-172 SS1]
MSTYTIKKMPYVNLGKSGLKVSKIILGTMQYGSPQWQGWVLGEEEGIKHIKHAYDMGIQTFDTANVYSNGLSEVILGKTIKQYNIPREEIVVFSVVSREPEDLWLQGVDPDEIGYINQHGLSRKHIFDSVKASLKRLQLEYIDVLQCHRFDYGTPIEETMRALHDVVQAGYVRYIGMSSCYAYQFHAMQNYAITNNLTPFISMQNQYNLLYREEEREMLPTMKLFGVGGIPWSSLGRGLLTRPFKAHSKRAEKDPHMNGFHNDNDEHIIKRVEEIANKKGISMAQVSIAWLLSKEEVAAPIIGTTSLENLDDIINYLISAEGVNVMLTPEEIEYLEEPYVPRPTLGHA